MELSWLKILIGVTAPAVLAIVVYLYQRSAEKRTINCAVSAEIRTLLAIIIGHTKWWRGRMDRSDIDHVLIPFAMPVYRAQIGKIGMLDVSRVPDIVAFYSGVKFLNSLQATSAAYVERPIVFAKIYEYALSHFLERFGAKFDKMFEESGVPPLDAKTREALEQLAAGTEAFRKLHPPPSP